MLRCKILARWIITYLAAELEEDAEWGEDDGDEDVDAVRRALLHLARSVDLWSPGGWMCLLFLPAGRFMRPQY